MLKVFRPGESNRGDLGKFIELESGYIRSKVLGGLQRGKATLRTQPGVAANNCPRSARRSNMVYGLFSPHLSDDFFNSGASKLTSEDGGEASEIT